MITTTKIKQSDLELMNRLYEYEDIAKNELMERAIRNHYKSRLVAIRDEINRMLENIL
jgi:hypothetical protein